MFLTDSPQDDVVKLRSALSDVKFLAEQTLKNEKGMSEQVKSILDDMIKISDVGMYKPMPDGLQRAKEAFKEQPGCCGEDG